LQPQTQLNERTDFWLSCGHHLLDRNASGRLLVTDEFLKLYLARPELIPPPDACVTERSVHAALLHDPSKIVCPNQIAAITDEDARENWASLIAWRDQLLSHRTLEEAYLDIVLNGKRFPHLFINQLVHVILRNVLDGCEDALVLRAAELFFRPQQLMAQEGSLLSADEETVANSGAPAFSPLVSLLGLSRGAPVEVLNDTNAGSYWNRSDSYDFAIDLTAGRRGLAALGEVMVRWIRHLLTLEVRILPVSELRNVTFSWYLGLDSEATGLGDLLWSGEKLDAALQAQLVGLYELNFERAEVMDEKFAGATSYLLLAMTQNQVVRMKPQNILSGLPITRTVATC
jgi:hypothetical protein